MNISTCLFTNIDMYILPWCNIQLDIYEFIRMKLGFGWLFSCYVPCCTLEMFYVYHVRVHQRCCTSPSEMHLHISLKIDRVIEKLIL